MPNPIGQTETTKKERKREREKERKKERKKEREKTQTITKRAQAAERTEAMNTGEEEQMSEALAVEATWEVSQTFTSNQRTSF